MNSFIRPVHATFLGEIRHGSISLENTHHTLCSKLKIYLYRILCRLVFIYYPRYSFDVLTSQGVKVTEPERFLYNVSTTTCRPIKLSALVVKNILNSLFTISYFWHCRERGGYQSLVAVSGSLTV